MKSWNVLRWFLLISWASTVYDSFEFRGEIQSITHLLSLCTIVSPPTTAMSIFSRFPCRPRALAKSFRITIVPALLSTRTLPSWILPFPDLKWTPTTGIMLLRSNADVAEIPGGGPAWRRQLWKRLHLSCVHFSFDLHLCDMTSVPPDEQTQLNEYNPGYSQLRTQVLPMPDCRLRRLCIYSPSNLKKTRASNKRSKFHGVSSEFSVVEWFR